MILRFSFLPLFYIFAFIYYEDQCCLLPLGILDEKTIFFGKSVENQYISFGSIRFWMSTGQLNEDIKETIDCINMADK